MRELNFVSIGIFLIIVGFFILFIGALLSALSNKTDEKNNIKFSFFGMIGPFPIGFGNDKRLFVFTIILSLIFFVLMILFFYKNST